MCGWQVKLCDPLVTRRPYLSALEIRSLFVYKALYKFAFFTLFYFYSAAVWYDSLPYAVRADWAQLQGAFRTRYMPAEFLKYQHASELFNCKQKDMVVEDYCAHTQQLAKHVGADDIMLRFAILNGLRADLKSHVTRAQPATLKDL